ncbi:hypothetical protein ACSAZK_05670 [Methanosarcina sp. Mfa9]|uniref:hypothetical protein n=1 Tax=Methanosarcina sp. Mfa9 TaxID=3439063 RepID=UPI003F83E10F
MGTYYIFLSCNKISVEDAHIQEYINKRIPKSKDIFIRCIPKHDNLEYSKYAIDKRVGSSIYIVNTNEEPDYVNSWELGYAMGKGLTIIGYSEGKNEIKIPEDMKNLIRPIPKDINQFVENINLTLDELTPKEEVIEEDWNRQPIPAKKEFKEGI